MTERIEQRYCISNFVKSLLILKAKQLVRFSRCLETILWGQHKLRHGSTDSKMTTHRACQAWSKIKAMLCSLIFVELCITSMHWKDKEWQKRIINKFSVDSMMQFGTKDQTSGQQKTGSCIITMLQHIHCTWSSLFWRNMEFQSFTNLLLSRHGSFWLLVVSKIEDNVKRILFWE